MVSDRGESPDQAPQAAYDMALWQLTEQVNENRSFDTKAGVVLTVAAAFAGLFGASLIQVVPEDPPASVIGIVIACGTAVLAAFAWTLIAFQRTVFPGRWAGGPVPHETLEVAARYTESTVRLWLAAALADSFAANEGLAARKAAWFRRELYGAVTIGAVTVAAIPAVTLARIFDA